MDVIEQARLFHRKVIESQYKGVCTVYKYGMVKEHGITREEEVLTGIKEQPCHLSFSSSPATTQTEHGGNIMQTIQLYITPDVHIAENSKLVITQNGKTESYKNSGVVQTYDTHQVLELVLFRRWA